MSNKLQSLTNQVLSESGVIIAVAWLIAEFTRVDAWSLAAFALIYAVSVATKNGKTALGWIFVSAVVALSATVKFGLIS